MSQLSLHDKLLAWLEKQGYPLEMRVAAQLRAQTQFHIRQGWYYTDPESMQSREIDIVATADEVMGYSTVQFLIDCKAPQALDSVYLRTRHEAFA